MRSMRSRTRRQQKGGSRTTTRSTTRSNKPNSLFNSFPRSFPSSLPHSKIHHFNLNGVKDKIKRNKNYKNFRFSVLRRGLCIHQDYPKFEEATQEYIIILSDPKITSSKPQHLLVIRVNPNTVTMIVKFTSIDKINKRFRGIPLNEQSSTASTHGLYDTFIRILTDVFDNQIICPDVSINVA